MSSNAVTWKPNLQVKTRAVMEPSQALPVPLDDGGRWGFASGALSDV